MIELFDWSEMREKSVGSFRWGFVFRVFYLSEFWVLVALLFFDFNNVVEEKVDKIFSQDVAVFRFSNHLLSINHPLTNYQLTAYING